MKWLVEQYENNAGLNEAKVQPLPTELAGEVPTHVKIQVGRMKDTLIGWYDSKPGWYVLVDLPEGKGWSPRMFKGKTPKQIKSMVKESIDEAVKKMFFTHTDSVGNKHHLFVTDKYIRASTPTGVPLSLSNFMYNAGGLGYEKQNQMFEKAVRDAFSGGENKVLAAIKKVTKDKNWVAGKMVKESIDEAVKPLSTAQLKQLDKAASELGGSRKKMPPKASITPTLQPSIKTWVFKDEGDAEEFETFAAEEMNLKANSFKHKGQYAVEVYSV